MQRTCLLLDQVKRHTLLIIIIIKNEKNAFPLLEYKNGSQNGREEAQPCGTKQ